MLVLKIDDKDFKATNRCLGILRKQHLDRDKFTGWEYGKDPTQLRLTVNTKGSIINGTRTIL